MNKTFEISFLLTDYSCELKPRSDSCPQTCESARSVSAGANHNIPLDRPVLLAATTCPRGSSSNDNKRCAGSEDTVGPTKPERLSVPNDSSADRICQEQNLTSNHRTKFLGDLFESGEFEFGTITCIQFGAKETSVEASLLSKDGGEMKDKQHLRSGSELRVA